MAAVKRAEIKEGSQQLTTSPTNLKEAIDWILRITNQDGLENGSSTGNSGGGGSGAAASNTDKKVCICQLAEAVRDLFRNVDQQLEPWEKKLVDDIVVQIRDVGGTHEMKELIYRLGHDLGKFVRGTGSSTGGGTGYQGIISGDYTSYYNKDSSLKSVSKKASDLIICARILMGAIPLVFSGLSYLYWLCSGGKGGSNGKSRELIHYVWRMGYPEDSWRCKSSTPGHDVEADVNESNGLTKVFKDCNVLGNAVTLSSSSTNSMSFAAYLDQLRQKTSEDAQKTKEKLNENALVKLNILCSGYFRSLHTVDQMRKREPRMPRTIREILYWLTSLPYCPVYRVLISKIKDMFRRVGTAKDGKQGEVTFYTNDKFFCTIDTQSCTTFLLAGALVAPMVLLCIQDTIESLVPKVQGGKPGGSASNGIPIHDLYANSMFKFTYPISETESYYLLQDNLVALYYQLYFLQQQCGRQLGSVHGWGACRYGEGVDCDKCLSWICKEALESGKAHSIDSSSECGKKDKNKASPLQAFLTDCLPGFSCEIVKINLTGGIPHKRGTELIKTTEGYLSCYPPFTEHREHSNDKPGTECPIPMGFSGSFKGAAALGAGGSGSAGSAVGGKGGSGAASSSNCVGLGIRGALKFYAHDDISESALYQLVRCICSLTRRVPRSTGTLYGFFYSIGGVCQKNYSGNGQAVSSALKVELECCPGWRDPKCLMDALYNWRGGSQHQDDHPKSGGNHTKLSLFSLTGCNGGGDKTANTTTCGKYLYPLTGSLYNSVAPEFVDTYISWMVYLAYALKEGLRELQKAFLGISCEDCGCSMNKDCTKNECKKGTHGNPGTSGGTGKGCCCPNIVDCVGVCGLFYRFGFLFNSPNMLTGKDTKSGNQNGLRKCSQFYKQLEAVIGGELFDNLFKEIYRFLYSTRALFGVYIGVYWLAVMGYLLWSMTVNLDLIHIQSHWRSPRSYLVPLQRILAYGSRKGFCSVGYFQESGDRLLSEGISDVYL